MTHRDTQLHRERQDPRPTHIFVVNKSLSGMGRSAYFHGDKMIFTCLHFGPSSLFSATSGRSPEPEEVGLPPSSVQRPLQSPGPRGGGGVGREPSLSQGKGKPELAGPTLGLALGLLPPNFICLTPLRCPPLYSPLLPHGPTSSRKPVLTILTLCSPPPQPILPPCPPSLALEVTQAQGSRTLAFLFF